MSRPGHRLLLLRVALLANNNQRRIHHGKQRQTKRIQRQETGTQASPGCEIKIGFKINDGSRLVSLARQMLCRVWTKQSLRHYARMPLPSQPSNSGTLGNPGNDDQCQDLAPDFGPGFGMHGQLPRRDFSPPDLLLLLRTVRSCHTSRPPLVSRVTICRTDGIHSGSKKLHSKPTRAHNPHDRHSPSLQST